MVERPVAGSEITEGDLHPDVVELAEHDKRAGAVLDEHALCDLQSHQAWISASQGKKGRGGRREVERPELFAQHIDRRREVVALAAIQPAGSISTGLFQGPSSDVGHAVEPFGERYWQCRHDQSPFGWAQRNRTSTPTIRPSAVSTIGW